MHHIWKKNIRAVVPDRAPEPEIPQGSVCGNGTCETGEDSSNCLQDCPVPELESTLISEAFAYWSSDIIDGSTDDLSVDLKGNYNGAGSHVEQVPGGITNEAYKFDGDNDYFNIIDAFTYFDHPSGEAKTISAWVYITQANHTGTIISRYHYPDNDGSEKTYGYALTLSSGQVRSILTSRSWGDGVWTDIRTPDDIPLNQWVNIVAVIKKGASKIYVNGSDETNVISQYRGNLPIYSSINNLNTYIGRDNEGRYFTGKMDEIGIWNRALTPTEVKELYDSYDSASTTP